MNEITIQELSPLAHEYALHLDPDSPANREMIELDCIGFVNKLLETYSLVRKITSAPQTAANDNTLEAAAREYVAHTEPEGDTSPNVSHSDIDIDELVVKGYILDPAKQFDKILKDGFRDHNRLHIAAQIAQGVLSNPNVTKSCADFETNQEYIAKTALMYADALIAESQLTDKLKEE